MKKSEEIMAAIEAVKAEFDSKCQSMVFDRPDRTAENHDQMWKEFWEAYGWPLRQKESKLEEELRRELNREIEVGDGVTICLWSDKEACTVIARTAKTLTVRRDKATIDPNFKPEWIVGGFSAHCTNSDEQKWTYEPDPDGAVTKFHWSEKWGRWQSGSDGSIRLIRGRHEFYDYNF